MKKELERELTKSFIGGVLWGVVFIFVLWLQNAFSEIYQWIIMWGIVLFTTESIIWLQKDFKGVFKGIFISLFGFLIPVGLIILIIYFPLHIAILLSLWLWIIILICIIKIIQKGGFKK